MKIIFLAIALLFSVYAHADESARLSKISQIVEAQGLQQMFQQQLDQSKATAADVGQSLYQKMLEESGITDGQKNPKLEEVFTQYLERCTSMFTAKELVATWSSYYGKGLSEADLDKILAYYKSPVGKKDVHASQVAMARFSQAMAAEGQKRMNALIGQLMADLNSALAK